MTKRTAGNFYFSFLTLSPELRKAMCALYAFMRITDDIGDDPGLPQASRSAAMDQWESDLRQTLAGTPADHVVWPAVGDLVRRYQISEKYLLDVIAGVRMDLHDRRIETFDDLRDYCYHVAGAVGLCCIHIWGFTDDDALPAAIDCGLAFQMTNILRDLVEDVDRDRIYLPQEDLRRIGYSAEDLAARRPGPEFRELIDFELARAEDAYARSAALMQYLAPAGRPVYAAMRGIYGGLLAEIRSCPERVLSERVNLSRRRKLWIVVASVVRHRAWRRW